MAEDDWDSPSTDWAPTGRRRSTYSPPPPGVSYEPEPAATLGDAPVVSPSFSPQLHEGDLLDSDESDEGDTEVLGFSPPPRRSLDDSQLVDEIQRVDTGTIEQISLLQHELELREADAREFRSWERAMLALGTPEALEAVEQARPAFTGVVPVIPPQSDTPPSSTTSFSTGSLSNTGSVSSTASVSSTGSVSTDTWWEQQPTRVPQSGTAPSSEPGPATEPRPAAEPAPEFWAPPHAGTNPGIDLPIAEDATVDAVLMDERETAPAPPVTLTEHFVVVDRNEEAPAAGPPPLVLPPDPRAESDLDRVLRARWLELDTSIVPPGSGISTDTGEGLVPEPRGGITPGGLHGSSDMRIASPDTGALANAGPPGHTPPTGGVPVHTGSTSRTELSAEGGPRRQPRVFALERSGVEATPLEHRNGRAARLVWLWFGANGSALSVVLGAVMLAGGMSLRQGIVAALVGIGLSFLPIGLGTLAGKRSGMPTMVVSRATFGLVGNLLPAALAVLTRAFWGAAFLWLLATTVVGVLSDALPARSGPLAYLLALSVAILLAAGIAVVGFRLFERIQLVLSVVSVVVLAGFVAVTVQHVDLARSLTVQDGPWVRVVGGAVLVFSVVGLLWAQSSSDLARYQRVQSSGARSMLWSSFGAGVPTFALIVWGCLLAASDPAVAGGLIQAPFATLGALLPGWFPVPLLLATALPLLSALTVSLYSGGLAIQATGLRVARDVGVVGAAILSLGLALLFSYTVDDMAGLLRDVATTIAVPVAAWAGIFCAEMMIRHRRFNSVSLLERGGVYADYRWVNLGALVVATVVGLGLTSASLPFLDWQGYLFPLIGMGPDGALGQTDPGVLVALGLGLLTPLSFGVSAVRRQEGGRQ